MTDPFARQDPAGSEALASWPAQCSPSGLFLGSALGSALGSVLGSALRSALGLVDEGRAMVSTELERLPRSFSVNLHCRDLAPTAAHR